MKKQLLQESDIRKMMKFANIGALSDGFVTRINETYMEEELEEQLDPEEDDEAGMPPSPDPVPGDEPPTEDPLTDDPGALEEEGDEEVVLRSVGEAMESFKEALRAAGPAGAAAAEAISVQETGGEEEDLGLGGEEDALGPDMDIAATEPDLDGAEEDDVVAETIDEDEMMNEVTRRVARRLRRLKKIGRRR